MSIKNWNVLHLDKENAQKIACENNIPFFLAMMLDIRNISGKEEIAELLSEEIELSDPFELIDMDKATGRIRDAIDNYEKICIYGDYDADGVTATALLYSYLENCGADVTYYIPNRNSEGYGMNKSAIDKLAKENVSLIITVDNGISAVSEIEYARHLGMDTVVTDHHQPPEQLPEAIAVVDPHRKDCPSKFKDFAGVGVAFKLICALEGDDSELLLENYSEFVLIGTIGDIVSLRGENRFLVKQGLKYIQDTDKPGIRAIMEVANLLGKPIKTTNVAFGIVPRINASGRISEAGDLVKLLVSDDLEVAQEIAAKIESENAQRKKIETEILLQVDELLREEPDRLLEKVIIVEGADWHPGVIGIVASRLLERYGKPALVISVTDKVAKGSGRSIEGFSLYECIKSASAHLTRFGGHPQAAGFELKSEDLVEFKNAINDYANKFGRMPYPSLNIDCKLNPGALNPELIDQLVPLEPFGKDNPELIFGLFNMKIERITTVGGGNHLRLTLSRDNSTITAMKFFTTLEEFSYSEGDTVDLAVKVSKSEYKNQEQLTVLVEDIKLSQINNKSVIQNQRMFEAVKRGECVKREYIDPHIPNRNDFAQVYRFLQNKDLWNIELSVLQYKLRGYGISICKLLIILDALEECGLILLQESAKGYMIKVEPVSGKVDLESSCILKKLRKRDDENE